ncbi:MAG: septation regulator SpoVG [Lachnospiraceae bacterium]
MEITDIRIRKVDREGKLKAVASITIDDVFVVHDIKVIEGNQGLFIAMPSKQSQDGTYRDIAHPIKTEVRDEIQRLILTSYEQAVSE